MNPLGLSSFSFEHYTNHWALSCPRPPTQSMQISYQKPPSLYGWETRCIWKYQRFSREAETVPWTGIWRQQMWLFGGQFWEGGWICIVFSCSVERRWNFTKFSQPIRRKWKCSHHPLTETISPPKWMCFDFFTLTTSNTQALAWHTHSRTTIPITLMNSKTTQIEHLKHPPILPKTETRDF